MNLDKEIGEELAVADLPHAFLDLPWVVQLEALWRLRVCRLTS